MQGQILASRYLLNRELGSGGMGAVYAATDLRTGGVVAVKLLHPTLSGNREYTARLRREAQIAASLTSPRVVRVIDLGTDDATGITYLVQEFVAGETLAARLADAGRLPADEALTVGREVAKALEAAHRAGIVHRDLKPANIMLTDGQVKVLDFGIARAIGDITITAVDSYVGTPAYCAPEREEGGGDIRSDIYSFGVMLYEMLAGRRPFEGATALRIMRQHATEPPPPLPADVPAAARAITERCLAKDPAARFQTPTDLAAALDVALANPTSLPEGVPANPATSPQAAPADLAIPRESTRTLPLSAHPEAEPAWTASSQPATPSTAHLSFNPFASQAQPAAPSFGGPATARDGGAPTGGMDTARHGGASAAAALPSDSASLAPPPAAQSGRGRAPLLAGGVLALAAAAAIGGWAAFGRDGGGEQARVSSPAAPLATAAPATPPPGPPTSGAATTVVAGGGAATPTPTARVTASPPSTAAASPRASATPVARLSPQQLHQKLLDTPFALDDFSLGLVPGAKERAEPGTVDRRHNAVGAVTSTVTGVWPLDDNSLRYTVFASDADARARFDEGFTGSDALVIHGPFTPAGMTTPSRGYHATFTSGGNTFGMSYCITLSGNVIVLGVSALDEITTQGSDETACIVARNALGHLRRVRGE